MAGGVGWFEGLSEGDRREVLRTLVLFCGQARAGEGDVPESIARSGIRPTHTPAVMLTKWRFGMAALPAHELTKSFRLLVALRRRGHPFWALVSFGALPFALVGLVRAWVEYRASRAGRASGRRALVGGGLSLLGATAAVAYLVFLARHPELPVQG
ncbi:DUF5958 family protein [Streptomyces sp. CL12]|uniref:DUF5958 family protein n=1 Tax=Streptomyces sp. CL12 TaxID=3391744 RepID=UPI003A808F83